MSGRYELHGNTNNIADKVKQLEKNNNKLVRMVAKLGTNADTSQFQESLINTQKDTKKLCQNIIANIRSAANDAQIRQISQEFQKELQRFTQLSKDIEQAEQKIVQTMSYNNEKGNLLAGDDHNLSAEEQQISQQFQVYDIEEIRNRTAQIKNIERDVVELHEMFQDLKLLVDEQQESLDVIENNVSDARDQASAANAELLEADRLQRAARKRQCCILFLVLAILAGIITVVVIVTKK